MKQIIDGKLYDTEKAELLCSIPGHNFYKTKKGNFFCENIVGGISVLAEEEAKDIMGQYNANKYIELFGEPEEA